MISQIGFVLVLAIAGYFLFKRIRFIRENIMLGKAFDRSDNPAERRKQMFLVAFGQQKNV